MVFGLNRRFFQPAVNKNVFLRIKHPFAELFYLPGGLIEILLFSRELSHIGNGRHAHKHIIQPDGIFQGTVPGKGPVRQTVLLIHNKINEIIYHRPELLVIFLFQYFDHGHA
ncbi:hypothetical protein D9M69_582660 [compost metagenome]